LVGGLLSEATGGDFATGVIVGGVNEALVTRLEGLIKGDEQLELAVSQLIGVSLALATGGDPAKAAELAKNATAYNQQVHRDAQKKLEAGLELLHAQGKYTDLEASEVVAELKRIASGELDGVGDLDPRVVDFLNREFTPGSIRESLFEPETWENYVALAIDLLFPTPSGKVAAIKKAGTKMSQEALEKLEKTYGEALVSAPKATGTASTKVVIDGKIGGQLEARGWTQQEVQAIVKEKPVGTTVDKRSAGKTPDGLPRNDPASVYGSKNGYVVVNDRTGEVVQVSGKNDPGWIPDSRINWE
jgi:filamentous hemagglutinin